jgi:hypothetical protein
MMTTDILPLATILSPKLLSASIVYLFDIPLFLIFYLHDRSHQFTLVGRLIISERLRLQSICYVQYQTSSCHLIM